MNSSVIKRLFAFIVPYKWSFVGLVLLILASAALAPLLPLLIQYTIDHIIAAGDYNKLAMALFAMIGLLFLNSVVLYFNTMVSGRLSQNIIHDIRMQVFEKIIRLKLKYYDQTQIGKLVTRTVSDVESLSDVFSSGFAAITGDLLQLFLIIGIMFFLDVKLTLICLCTVPPLLISTYIFKEKVKKSFGEVRTAVANMNAFVQERISGMALVQIFSVEKQELEKFKQMNEEHKVANIKSILYYSIYFPVADVISALGVGLIVWYGAKGVLDKELSFGVVTAFIMYINQFFRPIRLIADRVNTLQMGVVSVSRIFEILDEPEVEENVIQTQNLIKGQIEFKDVWFSYLPEQPILKGISFKVEKGEKIAIVGATGAGKTSIINLLNKFYALESGTILLDGKSMDSFSLADLRNQIGLVLQDVFLFSGSIYDNIRLGNQAITDEMIRSAAQQVGVDEFIEALPDKYDFNINERGTTLSVGQRQLLSFVRVLLQNVKILVLDEATSSVDSENEMLIQNAMDKLLTNRTAIIIAHRLSTIQKADKIIVLEKGEIVEMGSHTELLQNDGYYKRLYDVQFA
jgi:ATP-binding cassette, subfamily B, multidrug efflux pump